MKNNNLKDQKSIFYRVLISGLKGSLILVILLMLQNNVYLSAKTNNYYNPFMETSEERNKVDFNIGLLFYIEYLYYQETDENIKSRALPESQLINLDLYFNNIPLNKLFLEFSFFYTFHELKDEERWEYMGEELQKNSLTYSRDRIYSHIGIDLIRDRLALYTGINSYLTKQTRNTFIIPYYSLLVEPYGDVIERIHSHFLTLGMKGNLHMSGLYYYDYKFFYDLSGLYAIDVSVENSYYEGVEFNNVSGYGGTLVFGTEHTFFNFINLKIGLETVAQVWSGSGWEEYHEVIKVKWPKNYTISFSYFIGQGIDFYNKRIADPRINKIKKAYYIVGGIITAAGGVCSFIGYDYHQKGDAVYDEYSGAADSSEALELGDKMQDYYDKSEMCYNWGYKLYIIGGNYILNGLILHLFKDTIDGNDMSFFINKDQIRISNNYRF
ncbi:MAG: hypothetical protein KKH98_00470 [Spirochaetes bacterium]|nr:hypothetical protein [Spirochaetota bacterium]